MKVGRSISAILRIPHSSGLIADHTQQFYDDGEVGLGPIVSTLSLGAGATISFRRKKSKSGAAEQSRSKILCTLFLQHGDITIMEGHEVQKVFEVRFWLPLAGCADFELAQHKVEPQGLRFGTFCSFHFKFGQEKVTFFAAATARYVGPSNARPPLRLLISS